LKTGDGSFKKTNKYSRRRQGRQKGFAMKESLIVAALVALTFSACQKSETAPSAHLITPQSVEKVFQGVRAQTAAYESVQKARELKAERRIRAIEVPQSCPKNRIVVVSWNAGNFGQKKSDATMEIMADVLREADIVLLQEINTVGGAQAVSRLQNELSETGAKWDMLASAPTEPRNKETEAYAVVYRTDRLGLERRESGLVEGLQNQISREPFRTVFKTKDGKRFSAYSFHAVPANKNPIREIRALSGSDELAKTEAGIIGGDFNMAANKIDSIFANIGFAATASGKTSLKQKPEENGNYRLHDFDHLYVKGFTSCGSGVIDFVAHKFSPVTEASLTEARKVSDHLPVWVAVH
jgi:deoxyribonuclease-1-like protein